MALLFHFLLVDLYVKILRMSNLESSQNNIKVSVLVLTYNQEKYVDDALQSVLHQRTDFSYEVVVGDDCSKDGTVKRLESWQKKYPEKVRILKSDKNQGLLPNFIRTFNSCKGQYVAICEGDDYWIDKEKLQRQADILDNNPQYNTCIHRVVNYYEDTNEKSLSNGNQKAINNIVDLAKSNFITNVSAMFRAKLVNNLPDWFPTVGTYDYALHMLNAEDGDIYYMEKPMAIYRKHAGAIWSKNKVSSQLLLSMQVREPLLKHFQSRNKEVFDTLLLSYKACAYALINHYDDNGDCNGMEEIERRIIAIYPEITTAEIEQECASMAVIKKCLKQKIFMRCKKLRGLASRFIPVPKPA